MELFQQTHDEHGGYVPEAHLAEMIALLGPPPPELVTRVQSMLGSRWPVAIQREDGKICESPVEYFGGPFFDKHGK